MPKIHVTDASGGSHVVDAPNGESLMSALLNEGIEGGIGTIKMMKKGVNRDLSELKMGSYKLLTGAEKFLKKCQVCISEYIKGKKKG